MLPPDDLKFLADRAIPHTIATEANMLCIVLTDFALPPGFDRPKADLLLRIAPGYPDIAPDMWWFDPPVRRADGAAIPATQVIEQHLGRRWQRWSRHLNSGQWRSGVDSLESFLALVHGELARATPVAAQ
jgi:Prokaryotic E2 family E